ncbi:MAG: 3-hydroxyacyl-ACP dehydratase FabZ [Planctomycetota bacterium]
MTDTTDSLNEIHRAIPHRAPMLLVDEIITRDENTIHCRKTFHADEFFFQGHYPDHPLVPGVILCEATVQAGAVLLSGLAGIQNGMPVLTRMNDVKFKNMVRPGDQIDIHVKLDEVVSNAYYLTGQAKTKGKTAARLSFTCTMAEAT